MRRDGLAKHVAQGLARRGREELRVGHVEPDDQPQPVGEIEIERIGNLDVASERVEAHRLGVGEPLFEKLGARRPALLLGMPVLVERADHEEGPAVQEKPPLPRLEAPKPDDPLDGVDDRVAANELDDDGVEVGRLRRPRRRLGNGERRLEVSRSEMKNQARDRFAAARHGRREESSPPRRVRACR